MLYLDNHVRGCVQFPWLNKNMGPCKQHAFISVGKNLGRLTYPFPSTEGQYVHRKRGVPRAVPANNLSNNQHPLSLSAFNIAAETWIILLEEKGGVNPVYNYGEFSEVFLHCDPNKRFLGSLSWQCKYLVLPLYEVDLRELTTKYPVYFRTALTPLSQQSN